MYKIEDNSIVFSNGRRVKFEDFIAEAVSFENTIVIRLENQGWKKTNENVLAVDYEGNVKWHIAKREYTYSHCPYVQISRRIDQLQAFGWDGRVLSLNPDTGKTFSEDWVSVGVDIYSPSVRQYV